MTELINMHFILIIFIGVVNAVDVFPGETIILDCTLRGSKFYWQKYSSGSIWTPIDDDGNYEGAHTNVLKIKSIDENDQGVFRCVAEYESRKMVTHIFTLQKIVNVLSNDKERDEYLMERKKTPERNNNKSTLVLPVTAGIVSLIVVFVAFGICVRQNTIKKYRDSRSGQLDLVGNNINGDSTTPTENQSETSGGVDISHPYDDVNVVSQKNRQNEVCLEESSYYGGYSNPYQPIYEQSTYVHVYKSLETRTKTEHHDNQDIAPFHNIHSCNSSYQPCDYGYIDAMSETQGTVETSTSTIQSCDYGYIDAISRTQRTGDTSRSTNQPCDYGYIDAMCETHGGNGDTSISTIQPCDYGYIDAISETHRNRNTSTSTIQPCDYGYIYAIPEACINSNSSKSTSHPCDYGYIDAKSTL